MATLFTKIINEEIPAKIIYRDEQCVAFKDIHPQAPHHYLIVPVKEIVSIDDANDEDKALLGHLLLIGKKLAKDLGFSEYGYRLVTNIGEYGGQTVPHLHIHLMGGRQMTWPPG